MSKTVTVIFVENNPLDRAVLDLYMAQPEKDEPRFQFRYSYRGQPIDGEERLHVFLTDEMRRSSEVILLFDLGLSPDSERLMPDEKVQASLQSGAVTQYLTNTSKRFSRGERFIKLREINSDLYDYVNRIEGLRALFKMRLAYPMILCGIVSHYVYSARIREALKAFLMHNSALGPEDYLPTYKGDYRMVPLVIYKGDLEGVLQKLKHAWGGWQTATDEYYCKKIAERCLIEDVDGDITTLKGLVEKIGAHIGERRPPDRVSPIFVADFVGLQLPGVQHTLRRLFKPLFPDLLVIEVSDLTRMARDGEYLVTPNDPVLAGVTLSKASQTLCAAYRAHPAKQLVCVVGGAEGEEERAFELLTARKIKAQFCYRALSLPRLFSNRRQDDGRRFDDFIEGLVEAARDKAIYEDHIDENAILTSIGEMGSWLKVLSSEHMPADLSKFVDWVREAFCQGLQGERELQVYFKKKKRTDNRQKLEMKKVKGGD